ncbi:hypothetical protein ARMGADRAFT_440485 [Armillaria gallica]|uniref:Uncharacterized protein n=1 Tax=Armillaria gallica TaxID=47427 RepID=A0A2H3DKT5_ARMGA|nr:hypothetical protein ARMGADRAFT_440485 [Armillaria gallica]
MCILSVSVRHRCNRPDFPAGYLADLDGSCYISVKPTVTQSCSGGGSSREKGDIAGFWSIERRLGPHQNLRRSEKKVLSEGRIGIGSHLTYQGVYRCGPTPSKQFHRCFSPPRLEHRVLKELVQGKTVAPLNARADDR